ncbi:ATP-binding protein [Candidatus Woesearchaeota archaeon]|nr:ATP-binding protein [Candidatus Woesearchaeota archaeon]
MHKISISSLGPIENAEFDLKDITIITGSQASGKSTILKATYFLLMMKDFVLQAFLDFESKKNRTYLEAIEDVLTQEFFQLFDLCFINKNTKLIYSISNNKSYEIKIKNLKKISISFSYELENNLKEEYAFFKNTIHNSEDIGVSEIQTLVGTKYRQFQKIFDLDKDVVFIPADRSQFLDVANLSLKEDKIVNSFSYYIKLITKRFVKSYIDLDKEFKNDGNLFALTNDRIKNILKGEFLVKQDKYKIVFNNGKEIDLASASSGQRESSLVLHLLKFFMYYRERIKYIVLCEEPESHLYTDAQSKILELFVLFINIKGNKVLITTHSPYLLQKTNNLLYAGNLMEKISITKKEELKKVLDEKLIIHPKQLNAFFTKDGKIIDVIEKDFINYDYIDATSDDESDLHDKLVKFDD